MSRSIRRWLPLSYALNIMLGVVTLATLLIFSLQRFYAYQEWRYLERNADMLNTILEPLMLENRDLSQFEPQLGTLAFLTQTRIELYDIDGRLIADTGEPGLQSGLLTAIFEVEQGDTTQQITQMVDTGAENDVYITQVVIEDGDRAIRSRTTQSGGLNPASNLVLPSPIDIIQTPFERTFGLNQGRSRVKIDRPLIDTLGNTQGTLVLSEGPAYGFSIVTTVTLISLLAGGLAVGLAILFGMWQSRTLIEPLTQLAETTERMADGDLSVRAEVGRLEEIGEVAQRFNQMAAQIERYVTQLQRFVADAAHQINTPLTALRTQLELAHASGEGEQPSESTLRNIDQAIAQTGRLEQLTADLLHLSKLEVGHSVEMANLDLNRLILKWSEAAAARAEQAGIQLRLDLPAGPINLLGHAPSLELMLQNLFENGLKFTLAKTTSELTPKHGHEHIEIILKLKEARANLIVQDSGIGFDGDAGQVFERFFRGKNASSIAGSGLGLAIVKEVVVLHQGDVRLESNQQGCRVIVSLPLIRE